MPPVGFEPTISTGEQPKNHALDRAARWDRLSHTLKQQNYEYCN